jgi:hypothetical protein
LADSNIKASQDIVGQKIITPGKLWYDKIMQFALELPTQTQVIIQIWAEPAIQKVESLPVIKKQLAANADAFLKNWRHQLKAAVEQSWANTIDAVKKSQFWDGKRKVEAATT